MQEIINANTPYRSDITSTNGLQFKNGTGTTTLGAHIYFGSDDKETIADSYEWSKDGTIVANAQTITVDASGVSEKAVYSFKATVGGKVVASQSVTITNVNDGAKGDKGDPGATGIPGQAGADGKTSYLHIAYATNSTGTAGFDVSNATGKTYIGQYTDFTSADSTDPSKYTWSLIKGDKGDQGIQGIQGVDGRQGIPGPKGADGKTQYTHIAYANSADGKTDFSTSDSNRNYIGMCVNLYRDDSNNPSDYSWTLVKGADGTQGIQGKPGADGRTPYFHTAWAYSADGNDGLTTVYPNLNLFINSSAKTKDGFFKNFDKVENGYGEITLKATNTWVARDMWDGFSIKPRDYKPGDEYTMSMEVMFTSWNMPVGTTLTELWIGQRYVGGSWTTICRIDLPKDPSKTLNQWIRITQTTTVPPYGDPSFGVQAIMTAVFQGPSEGSLTVRVRKPKQELGSTATPHMPSSSEATTADWPSYIGQYTDFMQDDSTKPSDYTWSLIRGNDGERGPQGLKGDPGATGIPGQAGADGKTSYLHIAYATNSTGTVGFDVSNATGKTYIGQYTDFTSADSTDPSKYTWSLIKGDKGDKGERGIQGPAGSNGDPGKVVSDTEPSTRFKGLTWKYSGTTDLTASDGTVIKPNTEYYYNGTHWMINFVEANQMHVIDLSAISGTYTNGSIKNVTTDG
ncbi:collagen-like protein, partial [Lactococcus lactis]|uniref:collagen-like protein n=1 Tax=Lactococcus lactis TaxID=1358 RepID=UPI0039BFF82A